MNTENKTGKKKLVWIEDDAFMLDLITRKFADSDFTLINVSDGGAAVKTVEQEMPDAVVLDIILPNVNGFEILDTLTKGSKTKDIPVILFSNLGSKDDIEKGEKLGATSFLVKADSSLEDVRKEILTAIAKSKCGTAK